MKRVRSSVSAVIPVYCEGRHIAGSLTQVHAALDAAAVPFELIVVDDGSTDDTPEVLQRLAGAMPELRPHFLSRNFGKEAAIRAGLGAATGDAVIVMDSDLQHPPSLIPEMIRLWREQDFDVINAVKRRRGDEDSVRGWLSRLYYRLFARLAGADLRGASDFKLIDRRVVEAYCSLPERNLFFRGLVDWLGFRQASVLFDVADRRAGGSKWSTSKLVALAVDSITSFSTVPLHFVTWSGCIFLLFALILGAQTLYRKLSGEALEGFSTVILLLLIVSSVLMMGLGVIGLYLAKIYEEVKQRPRYLLRPSSEQFLAPAPLDMAMTSRLAEDRHQSARPVQPAHTDS